MARLLFSLVLSVVLAAGSLTSSVLHGQMQGAVVLVICSDGHDGSGMTTVTLDASGNPVTARHACLDCLAVSVVAVLPVGSAIIAPDAVGQTLLRPSDLRAASLPAPKASARDPPASFA